jgi:hypothetical protein
MKLSQKGSSKRVSHGLLTSRLRTLDILIATARQVPNRSSPMTGSHSTLTWDIAAMSAARSAHSARRLRRQEGDWGAPCTHVRTDPQFRLWRPHSNHRIGVEDTRGQPGGVPTRCQERLEKALRRTCAEPNRHVGGLDPGHFKTWKIYPLAAGSSEERENNCQSVVTGRQCALRS